MSRIGDFVKITTFDDGNNKYEFYQNKWKVTALMFGGGKVALENVNDPKVKIPSISSWKTISYR